LNGTIPVPDSYFTASSEFSATYAAPEARLDGGPGFWSPTSDEKLAIPLTFFIQVNKNIK